jgi:PPM family protein phosphatase
VIGYDSIEYASLTDVGIRRSHNQDAHATLLAGDPERWRERGHIFLVADGMGAHAVGEMAAGLAAEIIPHTYHKHASQAGVAALRKAFVEANASIHTKGQQNPEFAGMGTTTTALLIRSEGVWIGHVGDSRAYRVRDGQIEQLSFDHSLVWEMARRQGVEPEGLEGIPTNVIIRSLGPEPLVQVDLEGPHPAKPGDIYILCSDGLSGQLKDPEIGAIVSELPPAEACRLLVDLANMRGGPDNITVLVVRINTQAGAGEPKPEKPSLWQRLRRRWPLPVLFLGLLLTAPPWFVWYENAQQDWAAAAITSIILATIAIAAGIVGFILQHAEEIRRQAANPDSPRLHVYRSSACRIDRALVDKLAHELIILEQHIREKQWEADWSAYQQVRESSEQLLGQGRLSESLHDYCRAIRILVDTIQRIRPRGEGFQPVW